jgi:TIR domain
MAYEFDIFISYRRTETVGRWVQNHLLLHLQDRFNEAAPAPLRLSCDIQMETGVSWPDELKRRLARSGLLIMVCTADYFRSRWCMAEWQSFREREKMLGLFVPGNHQGLTYIWTTWTTWLPHSIPGFRAPDCWKGSPGNHFPTHGHPNQTIDRRDTTWPQGHFCLGRRSPWVRPETHLRRTKDFQSRCCSL